MSDEVRRVLSRARNGVIAAGYQLWKQARTASGRPLPGRQHLDAAGFDEFPPHAVFVDVVREGAHYRFRYGPMGANVAEIFARSVTGRFVEHIGYLNVFDQIYRRFSAVVDEKALVYGVFPASPKCTRFEFYEHLTLPLAADGQTVDMLFGVRCGLPLGEPAGQPGFTTVPLVTPATLLS